MWMPRCSQLTPYPARSNCMPLPGLIESFCCLGCHGLGCHGPGLDISALGRFLNRYLWRMTPCTCGFFHHQTNIQHHCNMMYVWWSAVGKCSSPAPAIACHDTVQQTQQQGKLQKCKWPTSTSKRSPCCHAERSGCTLHAAFETATASSQSHRRRHPPPGSLTRLLLQPSP